ncbi:glycosyltransferase family 9 protein [Kineosporia sp. J2-2]|uniref:Glycosyltransferase family 9 protein n=1 Tax=Kineosporia corallincola TaxID=2835133 RepID=A0ABS5TEE2_9ACTN|nr:glycosyltransferase family 9 protein [Kineosporia corallincola]MBT0769458.1 glycosyltransferase family 9 protein [Kineosporia corallincola]
MNGIEGHDGCYLAEHGTAPGAVPGVHVPTLRRRLIHPVRARTFRTIVRAGHGTRVIPGPQPGPERSVVVIRTDEIGDLVLTLPLFRALRQAWPGTRVTLIARPGPASLLRGTSMVDDAVDWHPLPGRQDTVLGQGRSLAFARQVLRRSGHRFDLAVLPRRDFESRGARQIAAAIAARTVGFDTTDRPMTRWEFDERGLLHQPVCSGDGTAHELRHTERLAAALGVPLDQDERPGLHLLTRAEREQSRRKLGDRAGARLVVTLGAGAPKRCWSPGSYAAVVAAAHRTAPVHVVIVGGPEDRAAAVTFRQALPPGIPVTDTTGTTTLRETLALLAHSDAYLGGDTGVMHLASSVGVPCLVVSCHPKHGDPHANNALNRFGPWSAGSRAVTPDEPAPGCTDQCRATAPHCIQTVPEPEVARQLLSLLASVEPSRQVETDP